MFIMAKTARDRGRAAADGGRVKFWKPKARRGGRGPFLEAETEWQVVHQEKLAKLLVLEKKQNRNFLAFDGSFLGYKIP